MGHKQMFSREELLALLLPQRWTSYKSWRDETESILFQWQVFESKLSIPCYPTISTWNKDDERPDWKRCAWWSGSWSVPETPFEAWMLLARSSGEPELHDIYKQLYLLLNRCGLDSGYSLRTVSSLLKLMTGTNKSKIFLFLLAVTIYASDCIKEYEDDEFIKTCLFRECILQRFDSGANEIWLQLSNSEKQSVLTRFNILGELPRCKNTFLHVWFDDIMSTFCHFHLDHGSNQVLLLAYWATYVDAFTWTDISHPGNKVTNALLSFYSQNEQCMLNVLFYLFQNGPRFLETSELDVRAAWFIRRVPADILNVFNDSGMTVPMLVVKNNWVVSLEALLERHAEVDFTIPENNSITQHARIAENFARLFNRELFNRTKIQQETRPSLSKEITNILICSGIPKVLLVLCLEYMRLPILLSSDTSIVGVKRSVDEKPKNQQLSDGEKLLYDGEKLLYDGEKLLYDGEKLLYDGEKRQKLNPG